MLFRKKTAKIHKNKKAKKKEIREKETRSWATKCKTLLKMRHFRSTHATATATTTRQGVKKRREKVKHNKRRA